MYVGDIMKRGYTHMEETIYGRNDIWKKLGMKVVHTEGMTYDEEYTGSGGETRKGRGSETAVYSQHGQIVGLFNLGSIS